MSSNRYGSAPGRLIGEDRWRVVYVFVEDATGRRQFDTASFEEVSEAQAMSTAGALLPPSPEATDGLGLEQVEVRLGRFEKRNTECEWIDAGPSRIGELIDAGGLAWRATTEQVTGLEGQQCLSI